MPAGLIRPDRPERILLTTDAVGGVWQYATDLATALVRRGVDVFLVVLGPAAAPFHPPGMEVIETGLALDWTARDEGELDGVSQALRTMAADLGTTTAHLHAPALVGGVQWVVPLAVVAHSCVGSWWDAVKGGDLPDDLRWRAERTRRGLHAAGAIVAPTRAFADQLCQRYGLGISHGGQTVHVIHNGRDPGAAIVPSPEGHVLTAGRLWDEGKNMSALDRAAAHIPILAAGPVDGPGASVRFDNLRLLGTLSADALARERSRASVFASVPRYEPFGLAVLEAAQSGLPLVLSDIPTLRELWDGAAIFVSDEDELAPALRRVLADPGDGGARAKARATRYTVDAMADRTLALHRTLA